MNKPRKKESVYDELLHRLMNAHYRFGDRIWVKEVSEEMGASRQPIMAALAALSAEGFVRIQAQVGCQVIAPSKEAIEDFYRMLARGEGLMAELAATRRTPEQLDRLEEINGRMRAIDLGDEHAGEDYRSLNRAFHAILHDMTRSDLIHDIEARMFRMSDFFIAQSVGFAMHMRAAAKEHDELISAITRADARGSREASEYHIFSASKQVLAGLSYLPGAS